MNEVVNILTSKIVSIWIAPLIVGVIGGIILRNIHKKDKKLISEANNRYLNSVRQYIISKVKINSNVISDIRKNIIKELNIKDKYIYNEMELKNKIITDISENNYINEKDKSDLISFTYEIFKPFNNVIFEDEKENTKLIIIVYSILVGSTLLFIFIWSNYMSKLDKVFFIRFEDGVSLICALTGIIVSFTIILNHKSARKKLINLFFEEVDDK